MSKKERRNIELQDYLANRDAELSMQDLIDIRDDYISYYKGVLRDLAGKFTYHLSQFVFFQEGFNTKQIVSKLTLINFLSEEFRSEVKVFASSEDLYNFFKIDKIINNAFDSGDCSAMKEGNYKEDYYNCRKLLSDDLSYNEYISIMNIICRTELSRELFGKIGD